MLVLKHWLNEPGVALFYEGQTVAAQKQAEKVTVMNAKNEAVTLYFDLETHLPVKKRFTWRDPADKERNVEEEIYDNYRMAQNIMTPYRHHPVLQRRDVRAVLPHQRQLQPRGQRDPV